MSITSSNDDLDARLRAAANGLRCPVDPADFKGYVVPILFFNWASDTRGRERAEIEADSAGGSHLKVDADPVPKCRIHHQGAT